MKRILLLLVLLAAASAAWSQGIDLVVMVDTSASMFRVFPDLADYLLTDLLTNRLRFGDTFHLLTFADTPEVEIAGPVDSAESIERILRHVLLLKPLGNYTDLVAALRFLASYVRGLPETNRKTILLLTDGIHDPPPDSPFRTDPEEVRRQLFQTAQEITRAGWRVHILRLPQNGGTEPLAHGGAEAATPARAGVSDAQGAPTRLPASQAAQPTGPAASATPGEGTARAGAGPASATPGPALAGSAPAGSANAPPADRSRPGGPQGPAAAAAPGEPAGALPDYVDDMARALRAPVTDYGGSLADLPASVGFPTVEFPRDTLRGGRRLQATFGLSSASPQALYLELQNVLLPDGTDILQQPSSVIVPSHGRRELRATLLLPEGLPPGRHRLEVELRFAGGVRVSPSRGALEVDYSGRPGLAAAAAGRARSNGAALLVVLLGAAGLALIAMVAVGLRNRIDIGSLGRGGAVRERAYVREREQGHPLVEMVVTMQNSHIGHRNVHSLAPGASRSVGGGRSAYLVYFVSVPPRIAFLTYDGRTYTFVPVRAELFPDVPAPVPDCIGREIPAVSPRGYRFTIVFRHYRSPLDELNELLTSIRVPERPEEVKA